MIWAILFVFSAHSDSSSVCAKWALTEARVSIVFASDINELLRINRPWIEQATQAYSNRWKQVLSKSDIQGIIYEAFWEAFKKSELVKEEFGSLANTITQRRIIDEVRRRLGRTKKAVKGAFHSKNIKIYSDEYFSLHGKMPSPAELAFRGQYGQWPQSAEELVAADAKHFHEYLGRQDSPKKVHALDDIDDLPDGEMDGGIYHLQALYAELTADEQILLEGVLKRKRSFEEMAQELGQTDVTRVKEAYYQILIRIRKEGVDRGVTAPELPGPFGKLFQDLSPKSQEKLTFALTKRQREYFDLFLLGFTPSEIADMFNVTTSAVDLYLRQSRIQMLEQLKKIEPNLAEDAEKILKLLTEKRAAQALSNAQMVAERKKALDFVKLVPEKERLEFTRDLPERQAACLKLLMTEGTLKNAEKMGLGVDRRAAIINADKAMVNILKRYLETTKEVSPPSRDAILKVIESLDRR